MTYFKMEAMLTDGYIYTKLREMKGVEIAK